MVVDASLVIDEFFISTGVGGFIEGNFRFIKGFSPSTGFSIFMFSEGAIPGLERIWLDIFAETANDISVEFGESPGESPGSHLKCKV
ncbi:MAG: hypothetical protein ACUZ8O_12790 [Candidatus Anammoxibacter sp.]